MSLKINNFPFIHLQLLLFVGGGGYCEWQAYNLTMAPDIKKQRCQMVKLTDVSMYVLTVAGYYLQRLPPSQSWLFQPTIEWIVY